MKTSRRAAVVVALATILIPSAAVVAQPIPAFDHLECFPIKDPIARGTATADLVPEQMPPFAAQRGCKIKLPARYYCTDVSKENLQPTPAIPVGGPAVGDFLCYAVACEQAVDKRSSILVDDQFGSRVVKLPRGRAQFLCVPAVRPKLTPTPTPEPPTPTPSGVVLTPTPIVGADPPCFWDGNECQGSCFTGRCVYDGGQNKCICQATFDLACDQFALGACAGHLCFAPGQVCVPGAQPTAGLGCHCVLPTPQPSPG